MWKCYCMQRTHRTACVCRPTDGRATQPRSTCTHARDRARARGESERLPACACIVPTLLFASSTNPRANAPPKARAIHHSPVRLLHRMGFSLLEILASPSALAMAGGYDWQLPNLRQDTSCGRCQGASSCIPSLQMFWVAITGVLMVVLRYLRGQEPAYAFTWWAFTAYALCQQACASSLPRRERASPALC